MKKFLTLILSLLISAYSYSASFDCTLAKTDIEVAICESEKLSADDEVLSDLYFSIRETLSESDKANLKSSQKIWLRQRNIICKDAKVHCIEQQYLSRIQDLQEMQKAPSHRELSTTFGEVTCNQGLALYLDEARTIALNLPQTDLGPDDAKQQDQYWIRELWYETGGYTYLLHDIAYGYSKLQCWEKAMETAESIENLGVKDSAWARIAVEHAKLNQFEPALSLINVIKYPKAGEIARNAVAKELVRDKQFSKAKEVLKGAGLLGNHFESYWFKHATNLATAGYHAEAVDYVLGLKGLQQHVRNAFGAMLLIFQERSDPANAERILSFYSETEYTPPLKQIAIYHLKQGNHEKFSSSASEIVDETVRSRLLLMSAARNGSSEDFSAALKNISELIESNPEANRHVALHNAKYVYQAKGQNTTFEFIDEYYRKDDFLWGSSHESVLEYLIQNQKNIEALNYIRNLEGEIENQEFVITILNIRLDSLPIEEATPWLASGNYRSKQVVYELFRKKYSPVDIKSAIDIIDKTKPSRLQRSIHYRLLAMFTSSNLGVHDAYDFFKLEDELIKSYWLLGLTKGDKASVLNTESRYEIRL